MLFLSFWGGVGNTFDDLSQPLGVIYSLRTFEILDRPVAPYDGYVLGTADVPIVNIGDSLTAICRVDD